MERKLLGLSPIAVSTRDLKTDLWDTTKQLLPGWERMVSHAVSDLPQSSTTGYLPSTWNRCGSSLHVLYSVGCTCAASAFSNP
eukprot:scaffold519_cov331-Pavlova_lutheri.AAC.36